jgi:uncharacterized repeat protein (TIGR03803 family)
LRGGAFGRGGILRFDRHPDGTFVATTLHSFNGADGAAPEPALVRGSDGSLYGTTNAGGANDRGTFFKITPQGR